MKRKKRVVSTGVVLGDSRSKCIRCRHVRLNEPYIKKTTTVDGFFIEEEYTCWRCCRDAESTLLIAQKWPLAFERIQWLDSWMLDWAPGVRELVAKDGKA